MRSLFLLFCLFTAMNLSCQTESNDSVYHKLYLFLDSQNHIPPKMRDISYNNYANLLYIEELLKEYSFPYQNLEQDEFGVYKLEYIGLTGGASFIFIKYKGKYKIFKRNNYSLIIRELIKIKKENVTILNDELFGQYIEKLVEVEEYEDRTIFLKKIEGFEYIHR